MKILLAILFIAIIILLAGIISDTKTIRDILSSSDEICTTYID